MVDSGFVEWWIMCVYTTDKLLNSFKEIIADKAVWWINWGRMKEYPLYAYVRT
jgi:hypothetical protein